MRFSLHFRNKNQSLTADEVLETLKEAQISTNMYYKNIKFIGSRDTFNILKLLISLEPELAHLKIHYRNTGSGPTIVLVEHYE